jgi:hypothetical protein
VRTDVYTFIADRPVASLKDKVRATDRLSQQQPRDVLIRLNQIMRGWATTSKHAVCKHTLDHLENFVWHRLIRRWRRLYRWKWSDVRATSPGPNGLPGDRHGGFGKRPGETDREQPGTAPKAGSTQQPGIGGVVDRARFGALVSASSGISAI